MPPTTARYGDIRGGHHKLFRPAFSTDQVAPTLKVQATLYKGFDEVLWICNIPTGVTGFDAHILRYREIVDDTGAVDTTNSGFIEEELVAVPAGENLVYWQFSGGDPVAVWIDGIDGAVVGDARFRLTSKGVNKAAG